MKRSTRMMNRAVISPYGLTALVRKEYERMGINPTCILVRTDGSVIIDWEAEPKYVYEDELLAEIEGGES